jgi:uncharacterized surface protein with fasciclin (FAS1) repeats
MVHAALFPLVVVSTLGATCTSFPEVRLHLRALQEYNTTEAPMGTEAPNATKGPMETPTPILQSDPGNETMPPNMNETWSPTDGNETMGESLPPNATETMGESLPPNATQTMPPEPELEIDFTTVLDVVATQSNLGNLSAAAAYAGWKYELCVYCNYTVFAPMDEAFDKLDHDLLAKLMAPPWLAHLRQVLANHATTSEFGAVLAADLVNGPVPMLSMENVTVTIGDVVTIASAGSLNDATVVETDLLADNGVIHKVDEVLLPWFVNTDIIGLANTGATVLAPTDAACNALGQETLASLSQAELTQIFSNHVLRGVLPSFAISDGQVDTSLGGLNITFSFVNDTIKANGASIVKADVLANNGIVHSIDLVLLPDSFLVSNPSPAPTPSPSPLRAPEEEEPSSDPTSTPTSATEHASSPTSAGSTNGTNDGRPTVPSQMEMVQDTPSSSNNPNLSLLSLLLVVPLGGVAAWYYQRVETKPSSTEFTESTPSTITTAAMSQSRPDPDGLAPAPGIRNERSSDGDQTARHEDDDDDFLDQKQGPDYKDQCRVDPNELRHGQEHAGPVVLADAVWIGKTEI